MTGQRDIAEEQRVCAAAAELIPARWQWHRTFRFNATNPDPHPLVVARARAVLAGKADIA